MTRIMIDFDNTMADYTNTLRRWLVSHCHINPTQYPMLPLAQYEQYDTSWPFTSELEYRKLRATAIQQGLYNQELPYDGVVETVRTLFSDGHEIAFVTSRADAYANDSFCWLRSYFSTLLDRAEWLGLYVGEKQLIAKSLDIDIAVEDNPYEIQRLQTVGVNVIHPAHSYCKNASGYTFHEWQQVPFLINKILDVRRGNRMSTHSIPLWMSQQWPTHVRGARVAYRTLQQLQAISAREHGDSLA